MRAYVVPIGEFVGGEDGAGTSATSCTHHVAFMQRKDHLLGGDKSVYCDKLLAIGGAVEEGETPEQAARRELREEVPGWIGIGDAPALALLYRDETITVFTSRVDGGHASTRSYIRATTEGVPALLTREALEALPESCWVYPAMKKPLAEALRRLEEESLDSIEGGRNQPGRDR